MNEIVFQGSEGQPLTNSVLVAEKFGKRHYHVMDTIKNLLDSHEKSGQFFVSATYIDNSGKENPMYIMSRDGFTLLAMGFTGQKALQFKLDYIEAFNNMEKSIKQTQYLPSCVDTSMLKQLVETTQVMAAQISQMQAELNKRSQPALPSMPTKIIRSTSNEQRISPRQCKYYTVKQVAKEYYEDAKSFNGFLMRQKIQRWDEQRQRWVLYDDLQGYGLTYTVVYEPADEYEEPREYMVWTPKGRAWIKEFAQRNACGGHFRIPEE